MVRKFLDFSLQGNVFGMGIGMGVGAAICTLLGSYVPPERIPFGLLFSAAIGTGIVAFALVTTERTRGRLQRLSRRFRDPLASGFSFSQVAVDRDDVWLRWR